MERIACRCLRWCEDRLQFLGLKTNVFRTRLPDSFIILLAEEMALVNICQTMPLFSLLLTKSNKTTLHFQPKTVDSFHCNFTKRLWK